VDKGVGGENLAHCGGEDQERNHPGFGQDPEIAEERWPQALPGMIVEAVGV